MYSDGLMEDDDGAAAPDRATLTREAIVRTAIRLADAEGRKAVTLRRLAAELGVTPMAPYWHFRNKDELLDGMAAGLFEEIDLSVDPQASWQDQLRALWGAVLAVLRAHPSVATLPASRTVSSKGGLRVIESMLEVLGRGGFAPAEATQIARHGLRSLVQLVDGEPGVVVREPSAGRREAGRRGRDLLESLPPERYPRLVEAAVPLSEGVDPESWFGFGLDLLLAGVEAMAPARD